MMVSVELLVFSGETCPFPRNLFPLSAPPESFSQDDLWSQFQLAARNSGNSLCLNHPFSGVTGCKVKFHIQAVSKKSCPSQGYTHGELLVAQWLLNWASFPTFLWTPAPSSNLMSSALPTICKCHHALTMTTNPSS